MSEQITKNTRLKIEDDLTAALSGDTLKNALDYVAYLKAGGILPETPDSNVFGYPDGFVCVLCVFPVENVPGWTIFMGNYDCALCGSEYQDYPVDESLKEFAWAHIHSCVNFTSNGKWCGCGFQPGRRIKLFGKMFDNVCTSILDIRNPDGETLASAKKLSDMWRQTNADVANKRKAELRELKENEWPCVKGVGVGTGRALGKIYIESLDVAFTITPRHRYPSSTVAFSGGGWVPATVEQILAGLRIGSTSRFEACKGPAEGWTAIETLRYQARVTYHVEMSINLTENTYSATVWMPDASGEKDTPYHIAKDFPFRAGAGNPAIPRISAIDTIYLGSEYGVSIIRDFRIVDGR
jgi:hypothetical protein